MATAELVVAPKPRVAAMVAAPKVALERWLEARHLARQYESERDELKRAQAELSKSAGGLGESEAGLRRAVIEWLVGDKAAARTAFRMRKQNPVALFFLGMACEEAGELPEAVESFRASARDTKDSPLPAVGAARALRKSGKAEEALEHAAKLEKTFPQSAEVYFEWGSCLEALGRVEEALDQYEKALSFDSGHAEARFRAAYNYDLRGEDAKALDYYRQIAGNSTCYANAMLNLGLLYEDEGDLDRAIGCFREVLRREPRSARAALYIRNSLSATEERVDEVERRERERISQLLKTPVADFELSVRSRNCLEKMLIATLGDLVRRTEPEMLAYKNFGETSLAEIKAILKSKNLHLGMGKEEESRRTQRDRLRMSIVDGDNEILMRDISELELSVRSRKCMARLDIQTIGDLITKTEVDLIGCKNFGQTSLTEVKQKLSEIGLTMKPAEAE